MQLWLIHPRYLDTPRLRTLWHHALAAQDILTTSPSHGEPAALRLFRSAPDPLAAIGFYLLGIYREADLRGISFPRSQIRSEDPCPLIPVPLAQLETEFDHLNTQLEKTDLQRYYVNLIEDRVTPALIFQAHS